MSKSLIVMVYAMLLCIAAPTQAAEPHRIDIKGYRQTFSETFRERLDVKPWSGPSKWIAHTPWKGDFGDARFADPDPVSGYPFTTGQEGLKITAHKRWDGKWESGLLSSLDTAGRGFSQAGGYFEARMKVPAGPGVWPAFWLVGNGDERYRAEIDAIEYYGVAPVQYHAGFIMWPKDKSLKQVSDGAYVYSKTGPLSEDFHTYGVEITDKDIIYYLDRMEVARFPAPPEAHQPLGLLVNLALGSGWPIDKTPNPSMLHVDYIKAFQRK